MSWNEAFAARYDEWAAHMTEAMVNGDEDVYVERKWRMERGWAA
jgi:hypothetical protein